LTLRGWFFRASAPGAATVLGFNGNAGHRGLRAPLASALRERGLQVLLFDYRGYGDNPGRPTEAGLQEDARAAWRYLEGRDDVDTSKLVFFGESLGTAVATALAVEHRPAALVLRSPFPSLVAVGRLHYPFLPVDRLLRDRFDAIEQIGRMTRPVLVIAGDRDRVVPVSQSRTVFDAIRSPKQLVVIEGAGHNDAALVFGERLVDAVVRFVGDVREGTPTETLDENREEGGR